MTGLKIKKCIIIPRPARGSSSINKSGICTCRIKRFNVQKSTNHEKLYEYWASELVQLKVTLHVPVPMFIFIFTFRFLLIGLPGQADVCIHRLGSEDLYPRRSRSIQPKIINKIIDGVYICLRDIDLEKGNGEKNNK